MKSMTGFGVIRQKTNLQHMDLRIRSVNSRFLEIRCNLPHSYQCIEAEIRQMIAAKVNRGTIDFSLQVESYHSRKSPLGFDTASAKKWLQEYKKVQALCKDNTPVRAEQMSQVSVLWQSSLTPKLSVQEKKDFFASLDQLLIQHEGQRLREGKSHQKDLAKLLHALQKEILKIKTRAKSQQKEVQQRIQEKWSRLKLELLDEKRMHQEISLYIEKLDINEEIIRILEHIRVFHDLMKLGQGKKLDFYCQEFLRECNTIGSKAQDAEITKTVIEAKGFIENIREIVQNIE